MGIMDTTAAVFKKSLTPKLDWSAGARGLKQTLKKDRPAAILVSEGTTRAEFSDRYKHLRITTTSALVFFTLCLLSVILSNSIGVFAFRLLVATLLGLLFFRYSYLSWVCRQGWISWDKRTEPVASTKSDFLKDIYADPSEILPKPLARTGEMS